MALTECEIYFKISDFGRFQEKLQKLGGVLKGPYKATDFYYQPVRDFWNPEARTIRIREWEKPPLPATIYITRNKVVEFGKRKYWELTPPYSRLKLFEGELETGKEVLKDLGFEPWIVVEILDGRLWHFPQEGWQFYLALEKYRTLGWVSRMGFVGTSPKGAISNMKEALKKLKIPSGNAHIKSLPVLMAEKQGGMKRASEKVVLQAKKDRATVNAKVKAEFEVRLKRFKKKVEKEWLKQEKEHQKEEKARKKAQSKPARKGGRTPAKKPKRKKK
ncbi:MAG TPA: hypothetical protein ENN60_00475 [archaeon]|nr:hypothetical protein [archaeon]